MNAHVSVSATYTPLSCHYTMLTFTGTQNYGTRQVPMSHTYACSTQNHLMANTLGGGSSGARRLDLGLNATMLSGPQWAQTGSFSPTSAASKQKNMFSSGYAGRIIYLKRRNSHCCSSITTCFDSVNPSGIVNIILELGCFFYFRSRIFCPGDGAFLQTE